MKTTLSQRISAFVAYLLPVIGWIYVGFFQRQNRLAMFHLKQAITLILFLVVTFLAWAAGGYIIAYIPYAVVFSMALFALVITAYIAGAVIWVTGMVNALRGRMDYLPLIGGWARRFTW